MTPPDSPPGGRLPDFYVVGHAKAGTTALYETLAHHPQVFVGVKEPRYFATELWERDIPRPVPTPKTIEEYRAWYAGASPDQVIGDVSPDYLWSADAARMIAEVKPDAKIVMIFREPASFLLSLHRQLVQVRVESETDFERALALEQPRREGRSIPTDTYWPRALLYTDHTRYTDQLRRYHEHFAADQVLVLTYDEYRRANAETSRHILRFIGVDDQVQLHTAEANPSVEVHAPRLNNAINKLVVAERPALRAVKSTLKSLTPAKARARALKETRKRLVFGELRAPDERVMLELRRRLAPEVRAFSDYLGQDLVSLWGYDAL